MAAPHRPLQVSWESLTSCGNSLKRKRPQLLQSLKPDDREALKAQLVLDRSSTGYLPNHLVAKIVTDFGHQMDEKMICRHRTGRCRCRGNL